MNSKYLSLLFIAVLLMILLKISQLREYNIQSVSAIIVAAHGELYISASSPNRSPF